VLLSDKGEDDSSGPQPFQMDGCQKLREGEAVSLGYATRALLYALPRLHRRFRSSLPKNPQGGSTSSYLLRDEGKTPTTWDLGSGQISV